VVAWDGYIGVRGNRYSVPSDLVGKTVAVRITLDDELHLFHNERLVARHRLQPRGWVTDSSHHRRLWQEALSVEQRDLEVYEEVARCS